MLDFVQQLVSGIALGCVYGLIALGFVLVYKATEVVNFAQGDLMMLGGFFAFTFIGILGLNYWIGFAGAVAAMALFGMLAERVVVRPILGYPQFSIIMATIGLGYFLRSVAGMIWGTDDFRIETPFSQGVLRIGSRVLAYDKLSVIAATIILCALLYLFFQSQHLSGCGPTAIHDGKRVLGGDADAPEAEAFVEAGAFNQPCRRNFLVGLERRIAGDGQPARGGALFQLIVLAFGEDRILEE